tara:strand:- start:65443 stop:65937 length:495 start_codon:yes stop_codon:yes gene_type:complete
MKKVIISALTAGFLVVGISCKNSSEEKVLTREVVFKKEAEATLRKASSDSIITRLDVEIADDEYQTQTGLMYRKSMLDSQGMLFVFDDETMRSFYMKNTEFALDIIFINSADEVVSIQKNAKPLDPTPLPSEGIAKYVLEVNAGLSDRWNLEKGDKLQWNKVSN